MVCNATGILQTPREIFQGISFFCPGIEGPEIARPGISGTSAWSPGIQGLRIFSPAHSSHEISGVRPGSLGPRTSLPWHGINGTTLCLGFWGGECRRPWSGGPGACPGAGPGAESVGHRDLRAPGFLDPRTLGPRGEGSGILRHGIRKPKCRRHWNHGGVLGTRALGSGVKGTFSWGAGGGGHEDAWTLESWAPASSAEGSVAMESKA